MRALLLALALVVGPTEPTQQYRATVVRVIDGDTYDMSIDLGFRIYTEQNLRLYEWNCPERNTPEGVFAGELARSLFKNAKSIIIERYRNVQSFARWVARVWIDGRDIGELLQPVCTIRT